MTALPRVRIGTLDVDTVTFDGALRGIRALVDAKQGGAVFTPNVDHVMIAERDAQLRDAYSRASLALADGVPVVWASRLLGTRIPEKVSGSDLILPLMRLAAEQRWRVYLLGGSPGVATEAAAILTSTFGVTIVGVDESKVDVHASLSDSAMVRRIVEAKPDLLLVALGCPKQELFIDRTRATLHDVVSIGIGASLDFVTGRVERAPAWMSRVGLEWTYRLFKEPGRLWRRYLLQDTQFLFVLVRTLLRARRRPQSASAPTSRDG